MAAQTPSSLPPPGGNIPIPPSIAPATQQPAAPPVQEGVTTNGRRASIGGTPPPASDKTAQVATKPFAESVANVDVVQKPKATIKTPKPGVIARIKAFIKAWQASRTKQAALKEYKQKLIKDFKEFIKLTTFEGNEKLASEKFHQLLKNGFGRGAILKYARETFQTENFGFLIALENYKNQPTPEKFASIKKMFIGKDAPKQINISDNLIQKFEKTNPSNTSKNAFDIIEKEISDLIHKNITSSEVSFDLFKRCCFKVEEEFERKKQI